MSNRPSLIALRAFEAAARHGNFSVAAAELHQTPSAVSHQIKNLEGFFGFPLFIRHSRHLELSNQGRRLFDVIQPAFNAVDQICMELRPFAETEKLSVHCSPSFASKWLGPRLPDFFARYPQFTIQLSSSATPIDLHKHSELDMVIAYGAALKSSDICVQSLGGEECCTLGAPMLLGGRTEIMFDELDTIPLIESQLNPLSWQDYFRQHGKRIPEIMHRPSFDRGALALAAAVDGLGLALESVRFSQQELANGSLVKYFVEDCRSVMCEIHFLCYRHTQRNSPKIVAFREWLTEACRLDSA
ncbi:LysR substrate-binding domain-containing protein [Pseudomonas mucidolens]|uniref:DNA-binding transcriptional regulator, LysR family n=2 Tax=Pseudomonas mucidolens TaxID=46679 RepID=A0A1H2P0A1_9PSED|nr:LysR substrate-binding domain-containing protein [Pseudomonas mucidolens]SDV11080.1 DNA-binding transcriptional regulator, LysR family [Pseudomonas mucidolens]SQH36767.1 LysR family transcriptional regulator [Pseudomonas mucidolens]